MKQKTKIAILTIHPYNYGGVLKTVKAVYNFCKIYFEPKLFFLGFEPEISAYLKGFKFNSETRYKNYLGMDSIEIGARWSFWEPGHYFFTKKAWERELKEYDYIFVVSGTSIAAHPAILLNKKFVLWAGTSFVDDRFVRIAKIPLIRRFIDKVASFFMNKIEKKILINADYIWTLSSHTKSYFEKIIGFKKENLEAVGYFLEDDFLLQNIDFDARDKCLIAVGRFSDPRKNITMLLNVFEKICSVLPEYKLFIVGLKPDKKDLQKFESKNFYKNVIFTGVVSNQELKDLYKKSTLKLITSYQEGFGIAGLEAMAFGLPIVSADCGGPRDYVKDGENGFLVKVNDINDMAQKSLLILENSNLHKKMSEKSLEIIRTKFSKAFIYSKWKNGLVKVYPELKDLFIKNDLSIGIKEEKLDEHSCY